MGGIAMGPASRMVHPVTGEELTRSQVTTATDASVLGGQNKWKNWLMLWAEKLHRAPETIVTPQMEAGSYMESALMNWYADKYNATLVQVDTYLHPDYPDCAATVDRIRIDLDPHIIVEGKCVSMHREDEWKDGVPGYVVDQCQWQMFCLGLDMTHVVYCIWGKPIDVYEVPRDNDRIAFLFEVATRFRNDYVLTGVQPEVDETDSTYRYLEHTYPKDENPLREATDEELALLVLYSDLESQLDPIERQYKKVKNKIRESIGIAEGFQRGGWKATWKADKNGQRSLRITMKGSVQFDSGASLNGGTQGDVA